MTEFNQWQPMPDHRHFGILSSIHDERGQIARISGADPFRTVAEMEAVARLVAQAPAMLALLEEALETGCLRADGLDVKAQKIINAISGDNACTMQSSSTRDSLTVAG